MKTFTQWLNEMSPPGWSGSVRAMITKHPDKFDSEGKDGKLNPYAIAWSQKKKKAKPHYKNQKTSTKGKPEKKEIYKNK